MRFRCIEDQRDTWPVRVLCDALEVSASGYYAWRGRPESPRTVANRALLADIRRIHEQHRERYGAPRIHADLRAEGQPGQPRPIERLMRRHGIRAATPRRYRVVTTDSNHGLPVAPTICSIRTLWPTRPNQVWLADITYIPTGEGWLYLAVDPRPVHPQGGRLGDARSHARRADHRRADHGDPAAAARVAD